MSNTAEHRNVLLGITGSIAAYKAAELARMLVTKNYSVRAVMTEAGKQFITPLTMESITGAPTVTKFWEDGETDGIEHIELADWADALVIAPATADIIAKLAVGIADTPLLAIALATKAKILIAPAMNVNMLEHSATRENLDLLRKRGVVIVEPEEGALACGWKGAGRLADPWEIFYNIRRILGPMDYSGKKVLITTGPTREMIDPVRFISNRSSGKMGVALAREAFSRGADVVLVHGPVKVKVPTSINCVPVSSTAEMSEAVISSVFNGSDTPDIVIMAAAVSDYKPKSQSSAKLKKSSGIPSILLEENSDILLQLGQKRGKAVRPVLIGFAVETGGEVEDLLSEVRDKLTRKKADMIVGNFADESFELDTTRVWLVDRNGNEREVSTAQKSRVANKILDAILKL